jgi:hypothetical protein
MKKFFLLSVIILLGLAILLIVWSGIVWSGDKTMEVQTASSVLLPEEAAIRHVREIGTTDVNIDMNTVKAIHKVKIKDLILVLVQYNRSRINGDIELCEMVVETEKTLLNQWESRSGAGLCHEVNDSSNSIPITIVSNYGTSTLLNRGYSAAFGYLRDAQITRVMVTWDDGQVQQAEVKGSTYMAVREGGFSLRKIDTLNNQNEIVYTSRLGSVQEDADR